MILLNLFNKSKRNERHFRITVEEHFDPEWYQKTYNIGDIDPFDHYCKNGLEELKNPNEFFDMEWYMNEYHDVSNSDVHPFFHYVAFGKNEGRYQNYREKFNVLLEENTLSKPENKVKSLDLNKFETNSEDVSNIKQLLSSNRGREVEINLNKETQLLSFDVWDTILRRKCHPDEIKLSSARYLYVNYNTELKPAYQDITSLYNTRRKSEDKASLTQDYEYRYTDALDVWLPLVFMAGTSDRKLHKVKNELIEHELKSESRSTVVDQGMLKVLEDNKDSQMIFASDFYMSKDFMQKLLIEKDLDKFFIKGYVSSDSVKNKRSGQMFDLILKEFAITNNQLFHIGDNEKADVNVPSKKGINSYYYKDNNELNLNQWFAKALNEKLLSTSTLHNRRVLSLLEEQTQTINNEVQQIGIRFAPVIIGLILSIIEKAKNLKLDTVYFFTREGIFLKEIYDLVTQADPYLSDYPKSEILEVSRLSTFAPSLNDINQKSLMRLWSQYRNQSPKAFCASLNIDTEKTKELFKEHDFEYDEIISEPWNNEVFAKLLRSHKFKTIVSEKIALQRKLLLRYLSDKGISSQVSNILIVDLGWRGTIQDNVSHLLDCHVHGCYLGLMGFLNQQPENSSKQGYAFDQNLETENWTVNEVGPLEMLCNALSGSTVGYKKEASAVVAIKKEEAAEDSVFINYTRDFQEGVKLAIKPLIDYVAIHALTSHDLKSSSQRLINGMIKNPPSIIAKAFFELTHNETFGTGEYQKMEVNSDFINALSKKMGSYLHSYVADYIKHIRWPEGFFNLKSTKQAISKIDSDLTNVPIEFYQMITNAGTKKNFKVALFTPSPLIGSGGHRTLFNLGRKLIDAGCELYCFVHSEGEGLDVVHDYLGDKNAFVTLGWPKDLDVDMAIATIAHSAKHIANMKSVKHKAYLVQDFEAWFNPVGDKYTINENSYTFGMLHFTVGKFLTHVLTHQYRAKAVPSGLGVDRSIYFDKKQERENAISFLYQPEKDRRNPDLAINALKIVKEKNPDVKIYVYGSDAEIELDFEVENLGLIRKLSELNDLYNKCKVGLCISMSNPSRIPFEFMSAGVVPVDIYRYNNLLDYPTGTIKLAYQSHESIAEAILQLLENETELESRKISCVDFSYTRSLDWEMDTFVNCALSIMNGNEIKPVDVYCEYKEKPLLADVDKRQEVEAFCDWQKKLAEL